MRRFWHWRSGRSFLLFRFDGEDSLPVDQYTAAQSKLYTDEQAPLQWDAAEVEFETHLCPQQCDTGLDFMCVASASAIREPRSIYIKLRMPQARS